MTDNAIKQPAQLDDAKDRNMPAGLPDPVAIMRFCEADEIALFLRNLKNTVGQDLQRLQAWSLEFSQLLGKISSAGYSELRQIHDDLNRIEMERFLMTYSVVALHNDCTHYRDVIAARVMLLAEAETTASGKKRPDTPFALVSMGSDGRKEQTLITDQDYLIVYGDEGGEEADNYFLEFSTVLVNRLEETGFKKCIGDIMPTNPTWCGSFSQWRKRLLAIVRNEFEDYAKNMMDLIVLSDARYVAGDLELAEKLANMIRNMERDYFQVLWGMAKAATEMKLALGFMKRLWTESSGEHKGEFNLKLLAWAPLVMNVRILAINQGIPITSTAGRISMLEKEGSFSATVAQELLEAYRILTKHRILLQIKVIKGIQRDSHHLNPYELPADEREQIRLAIIKIEELQKTIHANFNIV